MTLIDNFMSAEFLTLSYIVMMAYKYILRRVYVGVKLMLICTVQSRRTTNITKIN